MKVSPIRKKIEGAGLLSNNTAKLAYTIQRKTEIMERPSHPNRDEADSLTSFSTLDLSHQKALFTSRMGETREKIEGSGNSLSVKVASFNQSREAAYPPYRYDAFKSQNQSGNYLTIEDQQELTKNNRSITRLVPPLVSPSNFKQFDMMNKDRGEQGVNPNILRLSAKNILGNIDTEYHKILLKEQKGKPNGGNEDSFYGQFMYF